MKIRAFSWVGLMVASLLALPTYASKNNMGDHEWACKVTADSGSMAFAMIQADTRDMAKSMAKKAKAFTVIDTVESVQEVHECIQLPKERFRDRALQDAFERFPM